MYYYFCFAFRYFQFNLVIILKNISNNVKYQKKRFDLILENPSKGKYGKFEKKEPCHSNRWSGCFR